MLDGGAAAGDLERGRSQQLEEEEEGGGSQLLARRSRPTGENVVKGEKKGCEEMGSRQSP